MKVEVDLPEETLRDLSLKSRERGLSVSDYAAELLYQLVFQNGSGDEELHRKPA